ncbi:PepSY domain-containing protein [Cohnella nanjingensis]|uniref:PepSY domain-containing protein n=1 Tax=Cohnella nanjingensis TaxID=1387779 RepID=A0A7X0RMJ2_9BACL|nr:PepSY domain-containing protein [Cohnella nanjingensis]MBB6670220.1 PepSY domain-containing protein [Cohnella nanjingensis]
MKKSKSFTLLGAAAVLAAMIPLSAYAATASTPAKTPVAPVAVKTETSKESAKEKPEAQDPNEQAKLQQAAALTKEQATAAALQQVPGTVKSVELEDENGTAVYGVHIVDANGKGFDVKVDAKTGKVLKSDDDSNDGNESNDGDDN